MKKEGPRQGRRFWKCVQRECQFFQWDPLNESTEDSFSVVSGVPSSTWARAKSPRRTLMMASPKRAFPKAAANMSHPESTVIDLENDDIL